MIQLDKKMRKGSEYVKKDQDDRIRLHWVY